MFNLFNNQQMGYNQSGDLFNQTQQIQPQVGYYQQPQIGYDCYSQMQGYGLPKLNRSMILQYIQDYVVNLTQVPISRVEKIEETPNMLRHACAEVGDVSYLQMNNFSVPELGINVSFYFCTACGKLYIQKDFM